MSARHEPPAVSAALRAEALKSRPKISRRKSAAVSAGSGEPSPQGKLLANQGFTLLEVLVAITVFALGAAVMLSLVSGSLGNIRKVQLRTRTIEQAEAVMELALLDESIQGYTTFNGDFEDGTRWSVTVEEYIPPEAQGFQLDGRRITMPVKLLSYTVEMFRLNAMDADYRLQTLKMVRSTENRPGRSR